MNQTTEISICNLKGGVGKTVTAAHLAGAFVGAGLKVMIVDCDLQAGMTRYFEMPTKDRLTTVDVLLNGAELHEAAQEIRPGLLIVPTTSAMEQAELALATAGAGELRMKRAVRELRQWSEAPQVILFDCPSGWGMATRNALLASSGFIVPINCEKLALAQAIATCNSVQQLSEYYDPPTRLLGVLLTCYRKTNQAASIERAVRSRWGNDVFATNIRRTEKVNELAIELKTVADISATAGGTAKEDYEALALEVMTRCALKKPKSKKLQSKKLQQVANSSN